MQENDNEVQDGWSLEFKGWKSTHRIHHAENINLPGQELESDLGIGNATYIGSPSWMSKNKNQL